jgi:hypothetical protein
MTTEEKLDLISQRNDEIAVLKMRRDEAMEEIYSLYPGVKAALAYIADEHNSQIEILQKRNDEDYETVKNEVIERKKTVKGAFLMATYNKGRSGGWDSAKLEGFALVHPEILKAKKPDGEPTVSFRAVK